MRIPTQQAHRNVPNPDAGMAGTAWVQTLMLAAAACAGLLVVIPAEAANATAVASEASNTAAATRYQRERAACLSGQSPEGRTTCLKEAGAAYAEAKHGGLKVTGESGGQDAWATNTTKRCNGLPADETKACMARMHGAGSTSGSVASGGILRELVTVEPAASAASAAVK